MIKSFFTTLSYIFHPLFLPLFGLYFLFAMPSLTPGLIEKSLYAIDQDIKTAIFLIFATLMVLAPGISILIMYWSKVIESITMENRTERIYAISTVLMYTIFCYVYLRELVGDQPHYSSLLAYTFGCLLVVLSCLLFNFYIKISLHAAGIFAVSGALIGYFNTQANFNLPFLLILIIVSGLVCAGRIFLKAHSNKEVLLGMVVGFTISFFCMKFEWFL
ncbi:MAG: phosphatase PAP2 family protein [Crocinitomicaceae bacterium]